jgi:hypothetical protein
MATQKQIQANRSNAQLSTGPRTEPGKAISRRNALKTGIDARNEAASGEDPAALAGLAAEYDHEFQPLGVVERLLVDILIKDDWFLRRYRFLAADLVNHGAAVAYETKRGADFGAGFAANTNSFHRLHRHIVETERSFFTHLAELERRQGLRRQHQAEVDSSVTDSPQTENPEIGFVPQPPVMPATAPAATRSPQTPNPVYGFVPYTTPSVPPHNRPPLPTCTRPADRLSDPGIPK